VPQVVVPGDRTAERDASADGQVRQHGVEDLAAHVVEVDVDATRRELAQAGADGALPIVDRGIEAELLRQPAALLLAAGDTDDAAALDLRDLRRERPGRAGGTGDDDGVSRLRRADLEEAEVRGEPRHAEERERHRVIDAGRNLHRRQKTGSVRGGVVLPAP
jgi:hypothetical protein